MKNVPLPPINLLFLAHIDEDDDLDDLPFPLEKAEERRKDLAMFLPEETLYHDKYKSTLW